MGPMGKAKVHCAQIVYSGAVGPVRLLRGCWDGGVLNLFIGLYPKGPKDPIIRYSVLG